MSAALVRQAQPDAAPTSNRGRFQKGYDPRRHKFTREECSIGFWNAVESIVTRYPDAVMSDGRHMVVNFLKSRKRGVIN
ncbi:MAG TPA: hypothetical protein VNI02_17485 [Blastocatellia bacterium]|jgi:hypothetical protein|nr:hypothetical protein [Blastocatellia bacterium]